jgi:hypothetical protein
VITVKTEDLIHVLAKDEQRARIWPFPFVLGCGVLASALVFLMVFDVRSDIQTGSAQFATAGKLCFTLLIGAAALVGLQRSGVPAASKPRWWVLPVALGVFAIASLGLDTQFHGLRGGMDRLIGVHPERCVWLVILMAAVPLAGFLLFLRSAATTRPAWAGALAGLAAAAIGASLYALGCTNDSPLFVLTWYSLAASILMATGAGIGRIMLRW